MTKPRGFTLLELLIVLAILGLMAAIALPSYQGYGRRANRTVAKALLADAAAREEGWFSDRKTYSNSFGADGLNFVTTTAQTSFYIDINNRPSTAAGAIYNIAIMTYVAASTANCASVTTAPTPTSTAPLTAWTLIATPVNGQARDTGCNKICLSNDGTRGASGTSGLDCWTK